MQQKIDNNFCFMLFLYRNCMYRIYFVTLVNNFMFVIVVVWKIQKYFTVLIAKLCYCLFSFLFLMHRFRTPVAVKSGNKTLNECMSNKNVNS